MEGCTSELRDELLDWDDALPYEALKQSEYHSERADLAICLGTSLRVQVCLIIRLEIDSHFLF